MSWFLHCANVLVLVSFLARDILWLRVLSVVGGCFFIAFYANLDQVLWEGIAWNLLFIAINLVHIVRLVLARRPVRLSENEARLRQLLFGGLSPRSLRRLAQADEWREHDEQESLVKQGQSHPHLMVLLSGRAAVNVDGKRITELQPGRLVGELSWVTGKPPVVDVVTLEASRCLHWETTKLSTLLESHPKIHQALQVAVGQDIAAKLELKLS